MCVLWLQESKDLEEKAVFYSLVKKYFRGSLLPPFATEPRAKAGFTEEWYFPLVEPTRLAQYLADRAKTAAAHAKHEAAAAERARKSHQKKQAHQQQQHAHASATTTGGAADAKTSQEDAAKASSTDAKH
jgi:hypothetical protein